MVTGQTHNLWKLKDLGGIVTKENVAREGPGRYGSEVYNALQIFGPTVMTQHQVTVFSKDPLPFAQVPIGSAHQIRSTSELR